MYAIHTLLHRFRFTLRDTAWAIGTLSLLCAWYVSRIPLVREYNAVQSVFSYYSTVIGVDWEAEISVDPCGFTIDRPSTPGGPRVFEVIAKHRE
jgi:hypothetical protein